MKYTVIMTPTAKSDIVNLKSSLEQQIIDCLLYTSPSPRDTR